MDLMAGAFKPAYIDVFPASQTDSSMIFHYHLTSDLNDYLSQDYLGNKDADNSSQGHWEVYLFGSYEGPKTEDWDPDNIGFGRAGYTAYVIEDSTKLIIGGKIVSTDHNEVIRDICSFYSTDDVFYMAWMALHEIGHWFRLPDGYGGVMVQDIPIPPYFTNCHIKWIRKCNEFPGKWWVKVPFEDPCAAMCTSQ
jgi:hypothetical protein